MNNKRFLLIIIGIFLISIVSAVPVPSPHAFYGTVDYSDGKPVEGTIITQIDNLTVGSCEIVNGDYDLIVESEYGGLIYFYLEGENEVLETFVFNAFEITELNLIIEVPEEDENNQTEPEKPKSSQKSHFVIGTCEPNWECTGWSECINHAVMTRNCQDTNNCAYSYNKPIEKTGCETASILEVKGIDQASISFKNLYEPKNLLATINWILIIGILIAVFVISIRIYKLNKQK